MDWADAGYLCLSGIFKWNLFAFEEYLTGIRREYAGKDVDQGWFSGTIFTNKTVNLTGEKFDIDLS